MARGAAKQRAARPQPDAQRAGARRRSGGGGGVEQTLFFSRLRRQAKWVFVFLALVFAGGFVFLGVGSGSTGLGDLLQGNFGGIFGGGSSGPSVSKAQKRVKEHPNNAKAYLDLATALQAKDRNDEAIAALERYRELRPRDRSGLEKLASLYGQKAERLRQEAQVAQLEAQDELSGSTFAPTPTSKIGQALATNPVEQAVSSAASTRVNEAYTRMQTAYQKSLGVYKRLSALSPEDTNLQLQLATQAENAGDAKTAIAAYKRFLKLAPDDPNAVAVKQRVKQLQQSATSVTPSG